MQLTTLFFHVCIAACLVFWIKLRHDLIFKPVIWLFALLLTVNAIPGTEIVRLVLSGLLLLALIRIMPDLLTIPSPTQLIRLRKIYFNNQK